MNIFLTGEAPEKSSTIGSEWGPTPTDPRCSSRSAERDPGARPVEQCRTGRAGIDAKRLADHRSTSGAIILCVRIRRWRARRSAGSARWAQPDRGRAPSAPRWRSADACAGRTSHRSAPPTPPAGAAWRAAAARHHRRAVSGRDARSTVQFLTRAIGPARRRKNPGEPWTAL